MTDPDLGASPRHQPSSTPAPRPTPGMPAGLLLAWRAPLVAYGITLAASVLLGVLTLVALASGDAPSEAEELSDATDGLLAVLALPFQLTAMALGGRIGLSTDDFSVSLRALPLVLTATYVLVLARTASRVEGRSPAASRQERALVSGATAVGATVAIALVTRLLALRADDSAIHALSVSLVVGTLALTFMGDFLGRELRVVGLPAAAHSWTPAVVAWLAHIGLWMVVSLPILFVLAWIDSGFRAALSIPLWWPTAAFWTYAMGHLSGVGASGLNTYAWSGDGVLAPVVLLLGAVAATTFASLVWHLRARRTPAELAEPASWVRLPVAFAVGGIAVTLLSTISIGGGLLGVSGSFTVMPAAWTCLLLALGGLVAEALSRSIAPRLAAALPATILARLQGPAVAAAPEDGPAADPVATTPMSPEQARKARRIALVVGAGLALVVAAVVAVSVIGSTFFTPEKAAEDYVEALADGDVQALAESLPEGQELSPLLLTDEIYEAAGDRPTGYTLGDVNVLGDDAMVEVEADGGVGGSSYLSLEKGDKRFGIFQEWKVTEGLTSALSITTDDAEEFAINGVAVEAPAEGYGTFAVLPGSYEVDPFAGNEWVEGAVSEVAVALGDYASPDISAPEPSAAFVEQVDSEVTSWLDECMASTEAEPPGCPQSAFVFGDVRDLTWELTEAPTVDYDFFDPTFPMDLYVSDGAATATYEVDESYGFGARQWVEETDESSLSFSVEVDEVDGDLEVTPDSY